MVFKKVKKRSIIHLLFTNIKQKYISKKREHIIIK